MSHNYLKQHRAPEYDWYRRWLRIYHDGELIKSRLMTFEECHNEIDKLKENGYTRGYTILQTWKSTSRKKGFIQDDAEKCDSVADNI